MSPNMAAASKTESSAATAAGHSKVLRGGTLAISAIGAVWLLSHPLVRTPADQVALVGNACYWIRGQPEASPPRAFLRSGGPPPASGKPVGGDGHPHSELMLTPLDGGPARRVATGLSWGTPLIAAEDRVFWMRP